MKDYYWAVNFTNSRNLLPNWPCLLKMYNDFFFFFALEMYYCSYSRKGFCTFRSQVLLITVTAFSEVCLAWVINSPTTYYIPCPEYYQVPCRNCIFNFDFYTSVAFEGLGRGNTSTLRKEMLPCMLLWF